MDHVEGGGLSYWKLKMAEACNKSDGYEEKVSSWLKRNEEIKAAEQNSVIDYCMLCQRQFSSTYQLKQHIEGRKHRRMADEVAGKRIVYCHLCGMCLNAGAHAETHFMGRKHNELLRAVHRMRESLLAEMKAEREMEPGADSSEYSAPSSDEAPATIGSTPRPPMDIDESVKSEETADSDCKCSRCGEPLEKEKTSKEYTYLIIMYRVIPVAYVVLHILFMCL